MLISVVIAISLFVMPFAYVFEVNSTSSSLQVKDGNYSYNFNGTFYYSYPNDPIILKNITSTAHITENNYQNSTFSMTVGGFCFYSGQFEAALLLANVTVQGTLAPDLKTTGITLFQNESGAEMYYNTSTVQSTTLYLQPYSPLNINVSKKDLSTSNMPSYSGDSFLTFTMGLTNNTGNLDRSGGMYNFEWYSQMWIIMTHLNLTHNLLFQVSLNGLSKPVSSSIFLNVTDISNLVGGHSEEN